MSAPSAMTHGCTAPLHRSAYEAAVSDSSDQDLWDEKPWWCQPWTIVLSGVVAIAGSWLLLHRLWVTIPVVGIVLAWWMLFLVIAPVAYRNQSR